jgi:hypothetical protein
MGLTCAKQINEQEQEQEVELNLELDWNWKKCHMDRGDEREISGKRPKKRSRERDGNCFPTKVE